MIHVEDLARRVMLSLRRSSKVEIQRDFFDDIVEDIAEELSASMAMTPDEIGREISDVLMESDFVDELYASEHEIAGIVARFLERVTH